VCQQGIAVHRRAKHALQNPGCSLRFGSIAFQASLIKLAVRRPLQAIERPIHHGPLEFIEQLHVGPALPAPLPSHGSHPDL